MVYSRQMRMASSVRLDELLDGLDIESLRVLTPGTRLDGVVRAVVIADVETVNSLPPGALVLAPGVAGHATGVIAALDRASAAGAAGIALRESIWSAAAAAGVPPETPLPVIGVPDDLGWGELYELLTAMLSTTGRIQSTHSTCRPTAAPLFSFADAVALSLGGAVTIEDPQAEVLAYSNVDGQAIDPPREEAILLRRVPLTEHNRALYLELSRTHGPVWFETDGEQLPRLAMPVRAGAQILGFLWVVDGGGGLAYDAAEVIVDAARMAAVHLVRERALDDVGRRTHRDALRRVLDGARDRRLLALLGLDGEQAVGLLAAAKVPGASETDDPAAGWLLDFVALSARARYPDARAVSLGGVAYVLVGTDRERPRHLASIGRSIIERSAGRVDLQIGVTTAPSALEAGAARREADYLLSALSARNDLPAVATIDEVRSLVVLAELADVACERPTLLAGPVRSMLDPAEDMPDWCAPTLRAYFSCFGNLSAAASELSVHPNTLRYRLGRITEVLRVDLDDPDERLVLALQLRLLEARRFRTVPDDEQEACVEQIFGSGNGRLQATGAL
jgi:hypothetical protein